MTKVLNCGDLMPGCLFEARGNSEQEVLAQAVEHAKSAHGLGKISEDMGMQVRGAIHEEDEGEEQAEEVVVVESADGGVLVEETTEAVSEEQSAEMSEADGQTKVEEEAIDAKMSEILAAGESTEEDSEDDEEEGRARAAGA